jgi:rod shape-determining protein MreB and related proteins
VIALNSRTNEVLAIGHEAWQMIGRTPGYIVAVRPLRGGAITDFEVTERLIRMLFQRAGVSRFYRARVLICVPSAITHVEQRAVLEAARRAGAAQTFLIEQPMAAAIGASLPIQEPLGNMVVDVGGGTSEVAVISLGGVVALEAVRVGGFDMDAAIQAHVRREYGVAIGERTAEEIKVSIGSAFSSGDQYKAEVRGRDLTTGTAKIIVLSPEEVREAVDEPVRTILEIIVRALGQTPPDLAQDLIAQGLHLGRWRHAARHGRAHLEGDGAARPSRRHPPRVRRARRRPLPRELRPEQGDVHGPTALLSAWARPRGGSPPPSLGRSVVGDPSPSPLFGKFGKKVLGCLPYLPIAVLERSAQGSLDLGAVEGRECEHGAAAHGGFVPAGGEHGG